MVKSEYKKIKLSDIRQYGKNPRINDLAVDYVMESIKQCEYISPIIIDENNVILAGHTRYKALKKLGYKEIECVIKYGLTDEQKKKYRILDNKTGEYALWNEQLLKNEIKGLDFGELEIDWGFEKIDFEPSDEGNETDDDGLAPSCQHNVFENQEKMQFEVDNKWGIPEIQPTQTKGDKFLRFMDWKEVDDLSEYIAHFYYDDYKFMSAWREPDKYIDKLKEFKAVVSPDFSLYTDFPLALQILSCYRRNWCGAYWQQIGIDIIPDVVWGEEKTFEFCFDGIPKHSTVAVSTVGVMRDEEWNNKKGSLFLKGYNEMIKRLEPTTILVYGAMVEGIPKGDNVINIPSYYEEKRKNYWGK